MILKSKWIDVLSEGSRVPFTFGSFSRRICVVILRVVRKVRTRTSLTRDLRAPILVPLSLLQGLILLRVTCLVGTATESVAVVIAGLRDGKFGSTSQTA